MKLASLLAGALAIAAGIVKLMDVSAGSSDSSIIAYALCLIGLLLLGAGYIGRQKQQ